MTSLTNISTYPARMLRGNRNVAGKLFIREDGGGIFSWKFEHKQDGFPSEHGVLVRTGFMDAELAFTNAKHLGVEPEKERK